MPWWWFAVVGYLVVVLVGLFFARTPEKPEHHSIYDATAAGSRAVYLLLEDLGYRVKVSRRMVEGEVRWLLFPTKGLNEAGAVGVWVRNGGVLVLADEEGTFAEAIGLAVRSTTTSSGVLTVALEGKRTIHAGNALISPATPGWLQPGEKGMPNAPRSSVLRTWPAGASEPLVSVYGLGRGEVWLVNRPGLLRNEQLRASRADGGGNAVVASRLADDCRRNPNQTIYFDEYHHGMRERPGVVDLLLQPPLRWMTLQSVLVLILVLWRQVPRFGEIVPSGPGRRRSKEEYLDALANLLQRKRAYAEAAETVRLSLVRDLEQHLGLPAGTPLARLAEQAARRRGPTWADRLQHTLDPQRFALRDEPGFLRILNELEAIRHDFFATSR